MQDLLLWGALTFPQFDPVALEIGPLAIRWYALSYIVGLLGAWFYCRYLVTVSPAGLTREAIDDFLLWATLGVILGGRLGYVLFYQPGYYVHHPQEILYLWQGGMAFHGGLIGVIVAIILFERKRGVAFMSLTDIVACAAPIGLFLGRIANFINGELFGRPSDVPWAMVFPGGGPEPRHPSQLYQAGLEGLLLFLLLFILMRFGALKCRGLLSGSFLAGYGLARFIGEFFRAPDAHLGYLTGGLTMGQLLSLPMLLAGLALVVWARRNCAGDRAS
ncbi:prolipoprotein diacylglyceryl transferase [Fodinicurvata sediminis]|uniref:prolipoprotein diacylglyceryl transferase n=1 Tax=Fodinicurvata sediminis TaxID=1121832 RepID=UPI0003B4369F|nr:prolipoprotein diacylglyceryl transferase [Fodinicurvata sediminis]